MYIENTRWGFRGIKINNKDIRITVKKKKKLPTFFQTYLSNSPVGE